jgi:quinol monooxygenase YgiN
MISVIARWYMIEGREEPALAALTELAAEVEARQPWVWMYTIHTTETEITSFPTPAANEVVFFSVFADRESFEKHLNGPVFQPWMKRHGHLFLMKHGDLFVISRFLRRHAGCVRREMLTGD